MFNRILKITVASIGILYLVLLIPDSADSNIYKSGGEPYLWNKEQTWQELEKKFRQAKNIKPQELDSLIQLHKTQLEFSFEELQNKNFIPGDSALYVFLNDFFSVAPLIAAEQKSTYWLMDLYNRTRLLIKRRSAQWDINEVNTKHTLYSFTYGMRAAIEEVLLQRDSMNFSPVTYVYSEPSATPSADLLGIKVHSGDMLVSRGGAEVSALISRGNDYPGNFSHVALLYVDNSNMPYFIEAHIEKGIAVSNADQYLKDKKLRFMVLRPMANLPPLIQDPMLPHKAAYYFYKKASWAHIPYDFKMNFSDSSAMFCSEVASYAYKQHHIQLWKWQSTISSPGVVNWLSAFGVENFSTQMPSDLEYDPQLSVVAEWRDPETLFKDHIDNAVIDVMLEEANDGEQIEHNIWMLPVARIIKGYSIVLNLSGKEGKIPEGMSATQALKNTSLVKSHNKLKKKTELLVEKFITEKGYTPPYWELLKLAREAKSN